MTPRDWMNPRNGRPRTVWLERGKKPVLDNAVTMIGLLAA